MAKNNLQELFVPLSELFTRIAYSVRLKSGKEEAIVANNFPAEIENMGGGGLAEIVDGSIETFSDTVAESVGAYAFCGCDSLVSAGLNRATYIDDYAFYACSALEIISAPRATTLGIGVFYGSSIKVVDLPAVTSFHSQTNSAGQFGSTTNLEEICLPAALSVPQRCLDASNVKKASFPSATTVSQAGFRNCAQLTDVHLPLVTSFGQYAFTGCGSLVTLDLPSATQIVNGSNFSNCYNLKTVILRSETLCDLRSTVSGVFSNCYHFLGKTNSTYNPSGAKDGYVYVPRALIEDYKAATNWTTLSTQFRALEDYTVDGTITGALDPNKI